MRKNFLKYISCLLAVVMLLSFSGCGKKGDKADIGYISGNYQMIIDSVDEINCDYLLVYRSGASFNEIDSFVEFMEKLAASSSKTFQICPDVKKLFFSETRHIMNQNRLLKLWRESVQTIIMTT